MEKEEDIRNEMSSLSPLIPPKPTTAPPPGYFDDMPERVIQRWKEEENRVHQRRVFIRRWITIAAITIGVMVGGWWWIHQTSAPVSAPPIALSSAEAYQYVMENIDDFDLLMEQQAQWPADQKIIVSDSSATEEYLLEELHGNDIEQIF